MSDKIDISRTERVILDNMYRDLYKFYESSPKILDSEIKTLRCLKPLPLMNNEVIDAPHHVTVAAINNYTRDAYTDNNQVTNGIIVNGLNHLRERKQRAGINENDAQIDSMQLLSAYHDELKTGKKPKVDIKLEK